MNAGVTQRVALGFGLHALGDDLAAVLVGEADKAVALSEALLARGVWCPAIRPPTVPVGSSRLRLTASAALSDEEIAFALAAFAGAREDLAL